MTDLGGNAAAQVKSYVERIERLEEDRKAVLEDIREVLKEAKGNGFDAKMLRKVVRIKAQDKAKRAEEEALTEIYLKACGLL